MAASFLASSSKQLMGGEKNAFDKGEKTVVFVLSSDRSGSTWLGYMLGSTPEAAFVGEFFRAWDDTLRVPCSWCSAHGRTCQILAEINRYPAVQAFESVFQKTGKRVLIDNSKRTGWAEQFLAPHPYFRPYLLHLIRDPRGWYESERRRCSDANVKKMLERWVQENLAIRNILELNKVPSQTIFYEEIAGSPLEEIQLLCHSISCSFDPSALLYWETPHHAFAANGASSPVLEQAPYVKAVSHYISGDDSFYREQGRTSFVDQRWKSHLSEDEEFTIRDNDRVATFLNLYHRVMVRDGLHCLSPEERCFHSRLEGKLVLGMSDGGRIFIIRSGIRHWVTSMDVLQLLQNKRGLADVERLPEDILERIPVGPPVLL